MILRGEVRPAVKTRYRWVDPARPEPAVLEEAARVIRGGGIVAHPTETVYGLAADVFNEAAVRRVCAVKGRPVGKPLIVAVAAREDLEGLVRELVPGAEALMAAFWPGPLTLVLPRRREVPEAVTGGRDGVAVRMPAHPLALALLRAAGTPVTTTSANPAGAPPPVTAAQVERYLAGRIEVLLDGGPAGSGVPSTILDLTAGVPTVLRVGAVGPAELAAVLGCPVAAPGPAAGTACRP
ncbi:MAG: threonylcarbamoyl-AMP synthase [Firmicutes bacterium]|nr:threonylcarbamoyl-AMP synthase [Bacillota bacterium]